MRVFAAIAGVLLVTTSGAAQQLVFHSASFPDATSVQLSVVGDTIPEAGDYDFDVAIRLVEIGADGAIRYEDYGKHRARVKCGDPAYVGVGKHEYPIHTGIPGSALADWKHDLWMVFCAMPVS